MTERIQDNLSEIRAIAETEALFSPLFFVHHGVIVLGSLLAWAILGIWWMPLWWLIYLAAFVFEKTAARHACDHQAPNRLLFVQALLTIRIAIYCAMAVYLWSYEEPVYQLGTLGMIVASTLNSFNTAERFASIITCVAIPNAMVFPILAVLEYLNSGLSPQFYTSLVIAACVLPFFVFSIRRAQGRMADFARTRVELEKSQRVEWMAQVAGGVAHDFNNIMSVVSASLELTGTTKDPTQRAQLIATAQQATQQAASLTKQLLTLGRNAPLVPQPLSLRDAVDQTVALAVRVIPANVVVHIQHPDRDVQVWSDPAMLQSALLNLILNAKNAMPDGGTVVLGYGRDGTRRPTTDTAELVSIYVSDSGHGIPEDKQSQVFEPFYTTHPDGGSGLGLPMIKGFAEQSGGQVKLQSTVGVGTKVTLLLPRIVVPAETAPAAEQAQVLAQAPRPTSMPDLSELQSTIVVVEDNTELRRLIEQMLKREGYNVRSYATGDEALSDVTRTPKPALVITDLVMPGQMQGLDVIESFRTNYPDAPTILMSGYAGQGQRTPGTFEMADRFLEKPISLKVLTSTVHKLLHDETASPSEPSLS